MKITIDQNVSVIVTKERVEVYDGDSIRGQLMIQESQADLRLLRWQEAEQRYNAKLSAQKMSVLPAVSFFNYLTDNTLRSIKSFFTP